MTTQQEQLNRILVLAEFLELLARKYAKHATDNDTRDAVEFTRLAAGQAATMLRSIGN
jgi:hypothetical protein